MKNRYKMFFIIGFIVIVNSGIGESEPIISVDRQDNLILNYNLSFKDDCDSLIASVGQNITEGADDTGDLCRDMVKISNLQYACRDTDYVILKWTLAYNGTGHLPDENITYLVEKWSTNDTNNNGQWNKHGWATSNKYEIDGLKKKTEYKFRVTPFYLEKLQLGHSSTTNYITTYLGNEIPTTVKNVRVEKYFDNGGSVNALLSWDPLEVKCGEQESATLHLLYIIVKYFSYLREMNQICVDNDSRKETLPFEKYLTCTVVVLPYENGDYGTIDDKRMNVKAESSCEINDLKYENEWRAYVYSMINEESEPQEYYFTTPSCNNLNNYNYSICAPDPPEIDSVEEGCTNFKITWKKPRVNPNYYQVMFICDDFTREFTVRGNETYLEFDTDNLGGNDYFISIAAFNQAGKNKLSSQIKKYPRCLVKNDTKVPDQPNILQIEEECTNFNITWQKPAVNPDYYYVMFKCENLTKNFTVKGNETNLEFETDYQQGVKLYTISVTAINQVGQSTSSQRNNYPICPVEKETREKIPTKGKIITVIITAVPAVVLFVIVWRLCFFCKMLQKDVDMMQPEDSFRKDVSSKKIESVQTDGTNPDSKAGLEVKIYDEYEVKRDHVRLCQVLGEGEFGVVHKAVLVENDCYIKYVAVKTLRNKESIEEKRQLEKEMEVMKSVGKHRNIVSLLGCCTEDMMLIVEYCSLGDLRKFLRKTWRIKSYAEEAISEKSNRDLLERRAFSNILYDQSGTEKRYLSLSMVDLLSFSRQIALGMAYLAENRVVHRDVAARNVLLAEDMTAKIADFGLSRDVYERNIYMKNSTDRLPLRWMALESLQYQVFSTKSDVWSYGILLWEIMTLGGCPYPSLQTSEMYKFLQEGNRMERPKPCTSQLYDIMLSCWDAKPQNRPTFAQLVIQVEAIMKNESNRSYLDLSTCDYKNHLDEGFDRK